MIRITYTLGLVTVFAGPIIGLILLAKELGL